MDLPETLNFEYIDAQYRSWKEDPQSVSRDWQFFFQGFEIAGAGRAPAAEPPEVGGRKQAQVEALIYRYRDLGHLLACLDPLTECPYTHPLLEPPAFGLEEADRDRIFYSTLAGQEGQVPLEKIIDALRQTYCQSIGVEYMHLQDPDERQWLQDRMEPSRNLTNYNREVRVRAMEKLYQAALFEAYLNKRYTAQTRFSLEGAEALIPMLDVLLTRVSGQGCREVILGMAHRGRLNVQVNILQKPYEEIFLEFISSFDPDCTVGAGDVKYHNGYLADIEAPNGRPLRIYLVNNPSHLESVDPVVEGLARARQELIAAENPGRVLPLLIHGDAAFAGQGVVAETLNMSQLKGYSTNGTLHIVINNQIGYTTLPEHARSTRYATDVAKMLLSPVFHVHGEDIEAVLHTIELACDYRQAFAKDVVVDLICYRRYGHNEGDEPYFTQPLMYERIRNRKSIHQVYSEQLFQEGLVKPEDIEEITNKTNQCLEEAYQSARANPRECGLSLFYEEWTSYDGRFSAEAVETGVDKEKILELARKLNRIPEDFNVYDKVSRLMDKRLEAWEQGQGVDWANAEALAFASILTGGAPIRLSGQDCGRGTFSQRHAVLTDTKNGEHYLPLQHLDPDQGRFVVYNSHLSEEGVLGFEYGYSLARPKGLVLWEAQFGDFANNAQGVIDLYIVSGEAKWQRLSGLVMLLPHGWEGLGPEHSSARLERFLQLCAGDNIQVVNASTPAQYFHLLRRQVLSPWRKPLVVMTPKSLLRNPLAVSNLSDFTSGRFQEVLDDPVEISASPPRRVIFCSGKIFYELWKRRQEIEAFDLALVRLEQFNPWPENRLARLVEKYQGAREWCWVQEAPNNMGGYQFVRPRLEAIIGGPIKYIGREASSTPATGFADLYRREQASISAEAVGPPNN